MASGRLKFVTGHDRLSAALNGLPDEMRGKVLERATKRACGVIEVSAKRYAKRSEDTGALRASLTTKVVVYPKSGKAVGLVGPDKAYYVGKKKAGRLGRLLLRATRPAWYAHLVEYGHHVVAPVKGTAIKKGTAKPASNGKTWVAPKPFIRPAVLTTQGQQGAEFFAGMDAGYRLALRKWGKD